MNIRTRKFWIIAGFSGLFLSLFILYIFGFRLSFRGIAFPAEVSLLVPEEGSHVFIDNHRKTTTKKADEIVKISAVTRGIHTVLVAKDGFIPWFENIEVAGGEKIEFRPFLTSLNPEARIIGTNNPEYQTIKRQIQSVTLPTIESPLISADSLVSVWVDGNTIYARWEGEGNIPSYICTGECEIISVLIGEKPIRGVNFYAGRHDVLMVASESSIFALEVNPTRIQNFEPLYAGIAPSFALKDATAFYLVDGTIVAEVSF